MRVHYKSYLEFREVGILLNKVEEVEKTQNLSSLNIVETTTYEILINKFEKKNVRLFRGYESNETGLRYQERRGEFIPHAGMELRACTIVRTIPHPFFSLLSSFVPPHCTCSKDFVLQFFPLKFIALCLRKILSMMF